MNIYGKAMTDTKRQAHRKVVEMVLKSSKTEEGTGGPVMDLRPPFRFQIERAIKQHAMQEAARMEHRTIMPLGP
jgi:hypothetical protein